MDLYMLGRLALPVVIAIIGVAGSVTLFSGLLMIKRLLAGFERKFILRQKPKQQPSYRIRIISVRPSLNPPTQERD